MVLSVNSRRSKNHPYENIAERTWQTVTFDACHEDLFERRFEARSARESSEFRSGMQDYQKVL